jgi:predicted Rossmann fold nucleotide-binding protein DprA/Smf involved in DNA uptake
MSASAMSSSGCVTRSAGSKGRRARGSVGAETRASQRGALRSARDRPAGRGAAPRSAAGRPARRETRALSPAPRGQNKAKVLEALKDGPMTASEVAAATGVATGTVSTLLSKLSKSGEVVKAERGYRLPDGA